MKNYISKNKYFPNNIIISLDKKCYKFTPSSNNENRPNWLSYGNLEIYDTFHSCWIIDGQHRLYSFVHSDPEKSSPMPVCAFHDISLENQCSIFLDINKFQKPVPSDLVWDLNGMMLEDEEDGIISNAVKALKIPLGCITNL